MLSSGTTPLSTSGDSPVTLLSFNSVGEDYTDVYLVNEGAAAGFFSLDNGTTWARLPANFPLRVPDRRIDSLSVLVKRITGGTDLSGLYAWAI